MNSLSVPDIAIKTPLFEGYFDQYKHVFPHLDELQNVAALFFCSIPPTNVLERKRKKKRERVGLLSCYTIRGKVHM
jgi:hypothetical protein